MNMDISEYLRDEVAESIRFESARSYQRSLWSVILGLRPFRDRNQWCVLWGDNIQYGIGAFGDTPEKAMIAFDSEMRKIIASVKG
jgi:hypothetical protein